MARFSDPNEGLTQDRFRVWSLGDDLYSRAELEENWDTLDAIIGRPTDGVTVWPPLAERGVGKGIWSYLQKAEANQSKLGDVKWVWAPTQTALSAIITAQQLGGWEVGNGQLIGAGSHDMNKMDATYGPSSGASTVALRLPNLVDHYVVGVAHNSTVGTAGGITTHNGSINVGTQGAHTASFTVSAAAHQHSTPSHAHSLPAHVHGMQHKHYMYHDDLPDLVQTSDSRFGTVYDLQPSAIKAKLTEAQFAGKMIAYDPGYENAVSGAFHKHNLNATYTGLPVRGPTGGVQTLYDTDAGGSGTSGLSAGTTGAAGAFSQGHTIATKPLSAGMVPFIKVRNATGV